MLTSESMKCKKLLGENTQREKARFKILNYNSERRQVGVIQSHTLLLLLKMACRERVVVVVVSSGAEVYVL